MIAPMSLAPSRRTFLQQASGALLSLGVGTLTSAAPTTRLDHRARPSIALASPTVAGSRPMSRAMRTAFATNSPFDFAIYVAAASR